MEKVNTAQSINQSMKNTTQTVQDNEMEMRTSADLLDQSQFKGHVICYNFITSNSLLYEVIRTDNIELNGVGVNVTLTFDFWPQNVPRSETVGN